MPLGLFSSTASFVGPGDWRAVSGGGLLGGLTDLVEDIGEGIADVAEDAIDLAEDIGNAYLEGLKDLGEGIVDAAEAVADTMDDAFSKDGWMTNFMEEYVPGGGLVTSAVHAAAGNEAYAQMAALKGAGTLIEAGAAAAGGVLLPGPIGAGLGAVAGNVMSQILQESLRDQLPAEVRDQIPNRSFDEMVLEAGLAGAGGVMGHHAGKAFGNARRAVTGTAQDAAEEVVEKTTARLLSIAMAKKVATSPLRAGIGEGGNAAMDAMPPAEVLQQLRLLEQQATMDFMVATREFQETMGAPSGQIEVINRGIFAANLKADFIESGARDGGDVWEREDPALGTYYVRNGEVVWDEADVGSLVLKVEMEQRGMTLEEFQQQFEEKMLADNTSPEWTHQTDYMLGDYMVKNGEVVWGATSQQEADSRWATEEVQRRGFSSVEEYRESTINSWATAHEYQVEAGTASGEWTMGGQSEILGPYMVKDGLVVFGASNAEEADAMLPNQMAQEQGYEDLEEMREELQTSWRLSHQYDVDAGTETGEWQTGGQSEMFGPYMIKDGVVVFGAENEQQAEELLPTAIAQTKGFEDLDAMREELTTSWRMSHEYDVDAGTASGEWQTGGQSDAVGPYMIKDGEIAWGATTPEQAEQILDGTYIPPEEPTETRDFGADGTEDDFDDFQFDPNNPNPETPILIVDEPDKDGDYLDIQESEAAGHGGDHDHTAFDPNNPNPETPILIVDEPDKDGDYLDIQESEAAGHGGDHEQVPAPVTQEATIAALMAEIKALREEVSELHDQLDERQPETPVPDTGDEDQAHSEHTEHEPEPSNMDHKDGEDDFDDFDSLPGNGEPVGHEPESMGDEPTQMEPPVDAFTDLPVDFDNLGGHDHAEEPPSSRAADVVYPEDDTPIELTPDVLADSLAIPADFEPDSTEFEPVHEFTPAAQSEAPGHDEHGVDLSTHYVDEEGREVMAMEVEAPQEELMFDSFAPTDDGQPGSEEDQNL